jgi:LuxR family maltose regulon positive regulatory protein
MGNSSPHTRSARATDAVTHIASRLPRIRPDCLTRGRLLHQLDAGLASALTLVSAPAGFGKTTLLAQWVASTSLPVAWMTVREQDMSAHAFFAALTEAVQGLFPAAPILGDTAHLFTYGARAPQHYIAATLCRDLCETPGEFILVVDDYHLISDDAVHQLINDLIKDAPSTLHLVLSSRVDPSLSLDRLRAGAELTEIRAATLQFTAEEIEAFLTPQLGAEFSQQIAGEATRRTEGWIAGLRLAMLSLQSDRRPDEFLARLRASGGHHVMGYLVSEVLARQSLPIQSFLLRTSVLDQLCGDLCDSVTGTGEFDLNGHAALEQLDHLNLFITRLDDEGDWYRYHMLFQELLQHELLGRFGQTEIADLHRRASEWYAQRGMVDEALRHAFKADDVDAVARLVEGHFEKALNEERWRDLERWLALLPEPAVQERPALLIAQATVQAIQLRLSAIPPLLRRAESLMDAQPSRGNMLPANVLRGISDVLWAQDLYFKSESAEGMRAAARAVAALPPTSTYMRGSALLYAGLHQQLAGEGEAALRTLQSVVDTDESVTVTGRALLSLCLISRQLGHVDQCYTLAERLLAHAQRHHLLLDINWAQYFLGWVAYERNKLDEARDHFLAVSEQRYFAHPIAASDSLSALALTYHAQGRGIEAEEALQDLNHYAVELNHSFPLAAVAALRARLALARDDLDSSLKLLPLLNHPSNPPTPMVWLLPPSLTQARILLAQGDEDHVRQAVERLDELERFAQSTHDVWRLYTIHSLQAMARYELGQRREALTLLRQTLATAQPWGLVRTFADCGPMMGALLREVRRSMVAPEMRRYVDELQSACASLHVATAPDSTVPRHPSKAQSILVHRSLTAVAIACDTEGQEVIHAPIAPCPRPR